EKSAIHQANKQSNSYDKSSFRTSVENDVGNTLQPIVAGVGKVVGTIIQAAVIIAVFALIGYGSYSSTRVAYPVQSSDIITYPTANLSSQNTTSTYHVPVQESYKGFSGKEYKYDLSNPVDKIHYDTDIKAQMDDDLDTDPKREMDEYMGQRGGGAIRK
ncbi:MAG: hypothetical protein Q8R88_00125, partial [Desulfoprunum sp.]|nr:hypothetical protein [Desulfoprunum sp.]